MSVNNPRHKRAMLRQRDGNQCWVCGEPMQFDDPAHDEYATFEHITRQADKGSDALSNLALSHRACNESRGKLHERIYFDPAAHRRNQRLRARAA